MQIVKCEVALAGDVRACVPKQVTVPELVVLENIHGHGSILNVQVVGMDKRSHREELDRLHRIYGKAGETEGDNIVARLFPGYAPQLPVRLSDIGRAESDVEDAEAPARPASKKKAGKKKTAKKTAAKAPADEAGEDDGDKNSDPDTGDENPDDALS